MRILYYDCFAGISGDMNLGAMIDLGVDPGYLKDELAKLNIKGFQLKNEKASRRGISGTLATIIVEQHLHHHESFLQKSQHHHHRHLNDIQKIINESKLSDKVKSISLKIFQKIAEAEAKVHEIDIQKVHFHEVGALDSIADIVGAAICLDYLKVDKVQSSPIQLGGGTVKCEHGVMPVPAPATALIVEKIPVKSGLIQHEATTPTGAAILAAIVDEFTENISIPIIKTAYGIGQRDVSEVPNVLRVFLLEDKVETTDVSQENCVVLECNIDDMNPERYEFLMEKLFENGANDAWLTPITMKKLRPANMVSVLCTSEKVSSMKEILFEHSTTLGIREKQIVKSMLNREEKTIDTQFGKVRIKECFYNGNKLRYKPEYDDCKFLALKHNVSIATIELSVLKSINNGY
jgi:pyridinium-3,5-bisthiocarboxylic acid mononucleotide nickel chelatase